MIVLRQKEYGKVWEGTKKALKYGGVGAVYGAVLMPGKIIAMKKNKPKVALGLAGAGAIIGGGIGAREGYKSGVDKWKYENDPEYRKKVDKEKEQAWKDSLKREEKQELKLVSEFDYNSWVKLGKTYNIPDEFLRYVKFYKNTWAKNIKPWYDSITPLTEKELVECKYEDSNLLFRSIFPIPMNSEMAKDWYECDDVHELFLAWFGTDGDDEAYIVYNTETGTYGVFFDEGIKSLKQIILKIVKKEEEWGYKLSKVQKNMIREFKNKINTL